MGESEFHTFTVTLKSATSCERPFHPSRLHDYGGGVVAHTGACLDDNVRATIQEKESDPVNQQ